MKEGTIEVRTEGIERLVINRKDYDPEIHQCLNPEEAPAVKEKPKKLYTEEEVQALLDAQKEELTYQAAPEPDEYEDLRKHLRALKKDEIWTQAEENNLVLEGLGANSRKEEYVESYINAVKNRQD